MNLVGIGLRVLEIVADYGDRFKYGTEWEWLEGNFKV